MCRKKDDYHLPLNFHARKKFDFVVYNCKDVECPGRRRCSVRVVSVYKCSRRYWSVCHMMLTALCNNALGGLIFSMLVHKIYVEGTQIFV